MDAECAFCGRAEAATDQLFCQDCQTRHNVCRPCADEARQEAAQLGLQLLTPAA
jgi:hypothetical protein